MRADEGAVDEAAEARLRAMIGATPGMTVDQLRTAYDQAMHRATRSGDHQHALALSRAFDALPAARRAALYPSVRPYGPAADRVPVATATRARSRRRGRPARRNRRRMLAWAALAALLAAGVVVAVLHGAGGSGRPASPPVDLLPGQGSSVPSPAAGPPGIVPGTAPTGADGLVTVLCQPAAGGAGYTMAAPRGAVVTCANGAVPSVIG